MKTGNIFLLIVIVGVIGVIVGDQYYVTQFEKDFNELEKQRIITSNKLATAKIVHENLNHVRELVFKNMDFPGQKDSIAHETHFFEFATTCVNDLKLKLISVKPKRPSTNDRVTTYGYDIVIEGDFFKFGELCAKFENSRRIVSIESFKVALITGKEGRKYSGGNKGIRVDMHVNTYRVRKDPPSIEPVEKG